MPSEVLENIFLYYRVISLANFRLEFLKPFHNQDDRTFMAFIESLKLVAYEMTRAEKNFGELPFVTRPLSTC